VNDDEYDDNWMLDVFDLTQTCDAAAVPAVSFVRKNRVAAFWSFLASSRLPGALVPTPTLPSEAILIFSPMSSVAAPAAVENIRSAGILLAAIAPPAAVLAIA